jgi:hypothetical protein
MPHGATHWTALHGARCEGVQTQIQDCGPSLRPVEGSLTLPVCGNSMVRWHSSEGSTAERVVLVCSHQETRDHREPVAEEHDQFPSLALPLVPTSVRFHNKFHADVGTKTFAMCSGRRDRRCVIFCCLSSSVEYQRVFPHADVMRPPVPLYYQRPSS